MTDFTVTAQGKRLYVTWTDGGSEFSFYAQAEDDRITTIAPSVGHPWPVVVERRPSDLRRHGLVYHDADKEPWAAIVAEAREKVLAGKLATAAFAAERDAHAARQAEALRQRASAVRRALQGVGDPALDALLADAPDLALSDAYDAIQNSAW